jgi:hypothetical protein
MSVFSLSLSLSLNGGMWEFRRMHTFPTKDCSMWDELAYRSCYCPRTLDDGGSPPNILLQLGGRSIRPSGGRHPQRRRRTALVGLPSVTATISCTGFLVFKLQALLVLGGSSNCTF